MDLYDTRGFNITVFHRDNEFNINTFKSHLLPIFTHIYGKEEHVGIIEWMIRLIKDRAKFMCHAIPYHY